MQDPVVTPVSPTPHPRPTNLVHVVWEYTLRCDLACQHCGSRAGRSRERELTTDEALDVVRQVAEMGASEVSLIGGEAYLREDWDVIARAVTDAGMTCTMVTAGRGMTPERAARAAAAGIRSVSVSLDGVGSTHDAQRGVVGAFASGLAAARNLAAAGVEISVNTQVNRLTFPQLDELFELLVAGGFHSWQLQLTVPMGRAADHASWLLSPDDLLDVIPKVAELAERGLERGVRLWPGNNLGYFGPHEDMLRGRLVAGSYFSGCTGGRYTLGLEADGTVKGCSALPTASYAGGNVRERPIRAIWEQAPELRLARDEAVELWGYCAGCYYADVCRAGCIFTAHTFFARPGNDPYCHHRALEHDRQGLREELTLAEAPAGVPFDHGRFEIALLPARSAAERARVREEARTRVLAELARRAPASLPG
ncbi:MAG: radical SAM protein [Polyangiaceae bacterium]|nr:radical SAM protein [Polyangiaceae bacterium]